MEVQQMEEETAAQESQEGNGTEGIKRNEHRTLARDGDTGWKASHTKGSNSR